MAEKLILNATVSYGDVDRREKMLLPRIFKLLQDAAITHANQFGTGTEAMETRGETWVLNRIAASIDRYPRVGETLRVETWSSGIKGFKGFRDFRIFDREQRPIVAASSLWLYVSVKKKTIVRVPAEIAESFPVSAEGVWCPELETLAFESPGEDARSVQLGLRYSDFDVNEHVNNAAYLDFAQTALVRSGRGAYPHRVRLKFAKAIPVDAERVEVRIAARGAEAYFSVECDGIVFAQGDATD